MIGYTSFLGLARWVYKATNSNFARIVYNFAGLPFTLYSQGVSGVCDLCQISKLETMWFGSPGYIFDDNRLWIEKNIEKNFTLEDAFKHLDDKGK